MTSQKVEIGRLWKFCWSKLSSARLTEALDVAENYAANLSEIVRSFNEVVVETHHKKS